MVLVVDVNEVGQVHSDKGDARTLDSFLQHSIRGEIACRFVELGECFQVVDTLARDMSPGQMQSGNNRSGEGGDDRAERRKDVQRSAFLPRGIMQVSYVTEVRYQAMLSPLQL